MQILVFIGEQSNHLSLLIGSWPPITNYGTPDVI
jgi:hypothetical protein